jgi:excisionase family DNA binding protein
MPTNTLELAEEEQIRELHRMLQVGAPALVGEGEKRVELPASVYEILKDVVRSLQAGKKVVLTERNRTLTTQTAADMLGCSRPYLIGLLEAGEIPFQTIGKHRRIRLEDFQRYKKARDARRHEMLNKLMRDEMADGMSEGIDMPEVSSDI